MRRRAFSGVVFIVFLLLPSAVFAFWPISWELDGEKRFLGPFISYDKKDEQTHLTIRPSLFSYDSDEGGTYHYLFPFGKVSRQRSYFVPVYMSNRDESESDTSFLLFFGGKSPKGRYGGFFPFYGKLYDRYAKDEMGFLLWPLYSYTEDEGATKKNVLWPFFSFYGGSDKGMKVWPFYGNHERPNVRQQRFFAWPVFHLEDKNLDTDDPMHSFFAIPFYLRSTTKYTEYESVLWPFFTHSRNKDTETWNIPWPFFSRTRGREVNGFTIFPFVSTVNTPQDKSSYFLWPLYTQSESFVRDQRFSRKSVLAINRYVEDDRGLFFNVWPFFEYEKHKQQSDFLFPSIIPLRLDGINRFIKPVLTLYERKTAEDSRLLNILYGMYTYERKGADWNTRFAFLLSLSKDGNGSGFELFSGLFGMNSKSVKVFFIPFKRASAAE
ncbi:MAG TPA: hypothetical protein VHO84_08595 [Syntrophorhabdaceae bacterium]|nr:hypothetical protein [Syntrophorhabdaceae bacterium]